MLDLHLKMAKLTSLNGIIVPCWKRYGWDKTEWDLEELYFFKFIYVKRNMFKIQQFRFEESDVMSLILIKTQQQKSP